MPTEEDLALARIAVKNRLLTREQADQSLADLKRKSKRGKEVSLAALLVNRGTLSRGEVKSLDRALSYRNLRIEDKLYGRITIHNNFATDAQIREALDVQKSEYLKGNRPPRLGSVLISLGYLSDMQDERLRAASEQLDPDEYVARESARLAKLSPDPSAEPEEESDAAESEAEEDSELEEDSDPEEDSGLEEDSEIPESSLEEDSEIPESDLEEASEVPESELVDSAAAVSESTDNAADRPVRSRRRSEEADELELTPAPSLSPLVDEDDLESFDEQVDGLSDEDDDAELDEVRDIEDVSVDDLEESALEDGEPFNPAPSPLALDADASDLLLSSAEGVGDSEDHQVATRQSENELIDEDVGELPGSEAPTRRDFPAAVISGDDAGPGPADETGALDTAILEPDATDSDADSSLEELFDDEADTAIEEAPASLVAALEDDADTSVGESETCLGDVLSSSNEGDAEETDVCLDDVLAENPGSNPEEAEISDDLAAVAADDAGPAFALADPSNPPGEGSDTELDLDKDDVGTDTTIEEDSPAVASDLRDGGAPVVIKVQEEAVATNSSTQVVKLPFSVICPNCDATSVPEESTCMFCGSNLDDGKRTHSPDVVIFDGSVEPPTFDVGPAHAAALSSQVTRAMPAIPSSDSDDPASAEPSHAPLAFTEAELPEIDGFWLSFQRRFKSGKGIELGLLSKCFTASDRHLDEQVTVQRYHPSIKPSREVIRDVITACLTVNDFDVQPLPLFYEVHADKRGLYLVSEAVKGVPLSDHVATAGPMDEKAVVRLMRGVTAAVASVSKAGLMHRDIRPKRIVMDPSGEGRLLSFGYTGLLESLCATDSRALAATVGSCPYVAPERCAKPGLADSRTDLFSLAGVLWFALTGESPSPNPDPATLNVSQPLRDLIIASLDSNPRNRPAGATILLEQLNESREGTSAPSPLERERHCHRCGQPGDREAPSCTACEATLTAVCHHCEAPIRLLSTQCPSCRVNLRHDHIEQRRKLSLAHATAEAQRRSDDDAGARSTLEEALAACTHPALEHARRHTRALIQDD